MPTQVFSEKDCIVTLCPGFEVKQGQTIGLCTNPLQPHASPLYWGWYAIVCLQNPLTLDDCCDSFPTMQTNLKAFSILYHHKTMKLAETFTGWFPYISHFIICTIVLNVRTQGCCVLWPTVFKTFWQKPTKWNLVRLPLLSLTRFKLFSAVYAIEFVLWSHKIAPSCVKDTSLRRAQFKKN